MALLAAAVLVACNPVPDAVRPTIDWLTNHGLACAYSAPDYSGLAQWNCRASVHGTMYVVVVDGNQQGARNVIGEIKREHGGAVDPNEVATFLADTVIAAPSSGDAAAPIDAWVSANPAGGQTLVDGIFVTLEAAPQRTTLSLFYLPAGAT